MLDDSEKYAYTKISIAANDETNVCYIKSIYNIYDLIFILYQCK